MLIFKLLLILPLVVAVRSQGGVGYYGSSNVRNQGWNQRSLYRPRPPSVPARFVSTAAPTAAMISAEPAMTSSTLAPLQPEASVRPTYYIPANRPPIPSRQIGPVFQPALSTTSAPVTQTTESPSVSELRSIPQPELTGQPEPIPQSQPLPEAVPEPIPDPTPEPEPIPELRPNPTPTSVAQPQTDPTSVPEPIPERQPEPALESIPAAESKPIFEPEPLIESEPIPEMAPVPQPKPQPPISYPDQTPHRPGSAVALPPYLPKPVNERPPAFVTKPTYRPEDIKPTTRYTTPNSELPPQLPVTLPPVITAEPQAISNPVDGTLVANFDCKKGNGYYSVDRYCDLYIQCNQNIAIRHACPDGLNFNPAAKSYEYPCAYPSEVQCQTGSEKQNPNPTDECSRQYGFFPLKNGECSKYVMCQEGKATVMDCPYGLAFNFETSSCDWPENVPFCNPNAFKGFTCPQPPLDQDGNLSDIIYKYRYGVQCKMYVACERGHPRLLSCDHGLLFDEWSQSCIKEDLVQDCAESYNQKAYR